MQCQIAFKSAAFRLSNFLHSNSKINYMITFQIFYYLVYGDLAVDVRTYQTWFARFSSGDFDLNDCPEMPIEAKDSLLEELLEQDRQSTSNKKLKK